MKVIFNLNIITCRKTNYKLLNLFKLHFCYLTILDDITVAIAPGIGNSSETVYIRTFVHFVQSHGYRCAVLNHVGALSSVKVTAPRIFSYGLLLYFIKTKIKFKKQSC